MSTPNKWNLLKHQFDALVHDESVDAARIEKTFDEQVRRRFAEIINRAAAIETETARLVGSRREKICKMNQRDQELLDKQLWGVSRSPRNGGILCLAFVMVFLVGLSIGGILFAPKSDQMTSQDATVLAHLQGSPQTMR